MSYRASAAAVVRMSLVSKGSLKLKGMQYIGMAFKSGSEPYSSSNCIATSSASGYCRKSSHTAGEPAGNEPIAGWRSASPLHVTERSPRIFKVPRALVCPAFGIPTVIPYCA